MKQSEQLAQALYRRSKVADVGGDPRVAKARKALAEVENLVRAERADDLKRMDAEVLKLAEADGRAELARQEKRSRQWPVGCPLWASSAALDQYSGTTSRDRVKVSLWDGPSKLVWVTVPGHRFWSGRGDTEHAPTRHELLDANVPAGSFMDRKARVRASARGRVSRKFMLEAIQAQKAGGAQ